MLQVQTDQCFHCGESCKAGALSLREGEQVLSFCCQGCQTAYQIIQSSGHGNYYQFRNAFAARPEVDQKSAVYDLWEKELPLNDGYRVGTFFIPSLHCPSCIWLSERILDSIPGIQHYQLSLTAMRLKLSYDPGAVSLATIATALASTGYALYPVGSGQAEQEKKAASDLLKRMGVAGFFTGNMMIFSLSLYAGFFSSINLEVKNLFHLVLFTFSLPVLLYSARPIFQSALALLRRRLPGMEILTVTGISLAFGYSTYVMLTQTGEVYYDSIAFVVFALLCSRYLEQRLRMRTTYRLENLYTDHLVYLLPDRTAILARQIEPGMQVEIPPASLIPVDGKLLDESAEIDESFLTGEFRAVTLKAGSFVRSGSKTLHTLRLRAESTADTGTLADLRHWIDQALAEDPAERFFRITSQVFTVAVFIMAAVTLAVWWSIDVRKGIESTIALLIVACPCALALAVPVARIVALVEAYASGILVKNASKAFTPGKLATLFLDKTGTLSQGQARFDRLEMVAPTSTAHSNKTRPSAEELLQLAAALEAAARSSHPLALSLQQAASAPWPTASAARSIPGCGIEGQIADQTYLLGNRRWLSSRLSSSPPGEWQGEEAEKMETWLATPDKYLARFLFLDPLRPEAPQVLADLPSDLRTVLLSGDQEASVQAMARRLGLPEFHAEQLPLQKKARVEKAQSQGRVAFLGDGLNDTVALKAADLSLAFAGKHPFLHNAADVLFLREDLGLLSRFLRIRANAATTMLQNLGLAFLYNIVLLPLAMGGFLAPVVGAIFMGLSSISVTANALRRRTRAD